MSKISRTMNLIKSRSLMPSTVLLLKSKVTLCSEEHRTSTVIMFDIRSSQIRYQAFCQSNNQNTIILYYVNMKYLFIEIYIMGKCGFLDNYVYKYLWYDHQ